ncbi:MAG TPA: hypothetical protein VLE44_01670 [Candidatus Saccharimonadales bacterium]|nr:hypothetical protein [Candidatus Saccharimonadales bacterium]
MSPRKLYSSRKSWDRRSHQTVPVSPVIAQAIKKSSKVVHQHGI